MFTYSDERDGGSAFYSFFIFQVLKVIFILGIMKSLRKQIQNSLVLVK